MSKIFRTPEYKVIRDFYGDTVAERSQVPLINHIREGVLLLEKWGCSDLETRAFCIHPLVQNNIPIVYNSNKPISMGAFSLAEEYRDKANAYLCRPDSDHINDILELAEILQHMSKPCAWMLLADKVQNQKDFRKYHWFTHERGYQLEKYFNLWIETLLAYYVPKN